MPKSKGTGTSTPKSNPMDKAKVATFESAADEGESVGAFTRSRARRLSITVPDHISPPKKSRRSSISITAAETSTVLNESRNQDMEDTSSSLGIGKIDEEIFSKSNDEEILTPSPKKRKGKKANLSESAVKHAEIEEQEARSAKKVKNSGESCTRSVQEKVISEMKSSKREKSRKSKIMEKIEEDVTMEDFQDTPSQVEPSEINGIDNKGHKKKKGKKGNMSESAEKHTEIEEQESSSPKKVKTAGESCAESMQENFISEVKSPTREKSRKSKIVETIQEDVTLDGSRVEPSEIQWQSMGINGIDSKGHEIVNSADGLNVDKSMKMMDKSCRKQTPKSKSPKFDQTLANLKTTPQAGRSPSIEKLDNPLLVTKKVAPAVKLSSKKVAMPDESTPKNLESTEIENVGKTPPTVSQKAKAKKLVVDTAIEKTPKAVESQSNDNNDKTPLSVSKKTKKTDVEISKEKTPKIVGSQSIVNPGKTPLSVSKKAACSAKLSAKKNVVETAIEKTPKAVGSLSNDNLDNTPHQISKKVKLSAKKVAMEDESSTPNKVEMPLVEKITKTTQPISKKTDTFVMLATKESTPKKMALKVDKDMLAKTPLPVLKKPTSPAKLSAKKAVIEDDTDSDEDSDAESRKEIMRSAEKRIIRNLSTSESESRNHVKVLQLPVVNMQADQQMETSSNSDSAPEDVTFDASRQSALELLKQTVDSIKRDKQKKKEKRKERLDVWRQRKEENLIRLKESKANRDDASCSSSEESLHERNGQLKVGGPSQGKKTYIEDAPSKPSLKRLPANIVNSLPIQLPKVPKIALPPPKELDEGGVKTNKGKRRKAGIKDKMMLKLGNPSGPNFKSDLDFTQLSGGGKTTFGVVALNEPTLKTVSQNAANFKQSLLYGNRLCRVPASSLMNNRKKLQVNLK